MLTKIVVRVLVGGQKAPSAKRCIKTTNAVSPSKSAPERSESTERQKAH